MPVVTERSANEPSDHALMCKCVETAFAATVARRHRRYQRQLARMSVGEKSLLQRIEYEIGFEHGSSATDGYRGAVFDSSNRITSAADFAAHARSSEAASCSALGLTRSQPLQWRITPTTGGSSTERMPEIVSLLAMRALTSAIMGFDS